MSATTRAPSFLTASSRTVTRCSRVIMTPPSGRELRATGRGTDLASEVRWPAVESRSPLAPRLNRLLGRFGVVRVGGRGSGQGQRTPMLLLFPRTATATSRGTELVSRRRCDESLGGAASRGRRALVGLPHRGLPGRAPPCSPPLSHE